MANVNTFDINKAIQIIEDYKQKKEAISGHFASDWGTVVQYEQPELREAYVRAISLLSLYARPTTRHHQDQSHLVDRLENARSETDDAQAKQVYNDVLQQIH